MTPARLVRRYPELYHMAHYDSWPVIRRHGLLSTSALLDLFEVEEARRQRLESQWRERSEPIAHPKHGHAVIRDQRPLRPGPLARCLTGGMTPADWYRTLNGYVFFWVDVPHLMALVGAREYRTDPQLILTVDTALLVRRHLSRVRLSSINSGSILRGGALRGPSTFAPVEQFSSARLVELCVANGVPDVTDMLLSVRRRDPDGTMHSLYERS